MKFEFEYWMLGVIESCLEKEKQRIFRITHGNSHANCSFDCDNKFCELGKVNLILQAIDRERSIVTLKVEEQLVKDLTEERDKFIKYLEDQQGRDYVEEQEYDLMGFENIKLFESDHYADFLAERKKNENL